MKEWILVALSYFLSEWQSLLTGGVVVVSLVVLIMSILKKLLFNRIKNEAVRRVLVAWVSLAITIPVTGLSVICNGFDMSQFWSIYTVNCIGTILGYWGYENSVRDCFAWLGKKIILRFTSSVSKGKSLKEANKSVNEDVESLLISLKSTSQTTYRDDDLKNL